MSTKKTREAIAALQTVAGGSGIMRQVIQDALTEVEAIEKAARAMNEATLDRMKLRETALLMKSIAKDAP